MSWQVASLALLALALAAGFGWYEREKPPARVLAVVASLAALAVVGRLAFAAIPNVKPTTDIVLFAGYALGAVPGFAVGAVTAIVSNIFLSQGPWTVWQMAGWGAVGVGGAVLARALRGREPNRFVLAAFCGVAGLMFGAWMDVYQWTLAARQDLDTYVAVAGTSLPYNLAHAFGNVVFCLLIGPAFLRALARYRRRLEVRWERSPAPIVASMVALALVLAVPAAATAAPADRAERYLLRAQNKDGGFGAAPGQRSSPLYTGWTGLALGSTGRNPRDVKRSGGRSIASFVLRGSRSLRDIGEIERTALLADAAGLDAHSFGGRNLLAEIEKRRRDDGSISGFVSYTAFGVMALRAAGEPAGSATVQWLVSSQNADGGFGVARESASDSDMTGAALQALVTVGRKRGGAVRRAVEWLQANQNDDGGFGQFKGRDSNAQSTSYAVQGLLAAGAGNGTISRARAYLLRLQRADGSIAYSSTGAQTPVWVTAQALMALEGKPLPLAAVPRAKRRARGSAASDDSDGAASGGGAKSSAGGGKKGTGGGAAAEGGSTVDGGAPADPAAAGQAGEAAPEASGAEALVPETTGKRTAASRPQPVPIWAALLALAGVLGLLWGLHRYVLPGR
jgi:hypothetical protein